MRLPVHSGLAIGAVLVALLLVAGCGVSQPADPGARDSLAQVVVLPLSGLSTFSSLTADRDGRIVAAGAHLLTDSSRQFMLVARFMADGRMDSGFGTGGIAEFLPPGRNFSYAFSVIVDSQSRIVLCGISFTQIPQILQRNDGESVVTLVRLLPNGEVDPSFGINGVAEFPPALYGNWSECRDVREVSGSYYVAGYASPAGRPFTDILLNPAGDRGGPLFRPLASYTFLAKFDAQGTPDPTFGVLGAVQVESYEAQPIRLRNDDQGRLYVSNHQVRAADYNQDLYLNRYLPDGTLDSSYGNGGRVLVEKGFEGGANFVGAHSGAAQGLTVSPDGAAWLAGSIFSIPTATTGKLDPAMWHVSADGVADPAVRQRTNTELSNDEDRYLLYATRRDDGQLAATLYSNTTGIEAVVQIEPDGAWDRSFGIRALHIFSLDLIASGPNLIAAGQDVVSSGAAAIEFVD